MTELDPGSEAGAAGDLRQLQKAIRRIVRANDLQSRALAKATGLTAAQLVVLTGVAELGEVTTTVLSAYADLSPATVVVILENLEARGIVERYRSKSDRRIVHTRLTEKGHALIKMVPGPLGGSFVSRFAAVPAPRRAHIIRDVTALADMMSAR